MATKRKPYTKPRLRTIELEVREVMAIGCKTQGQGMPNFGKHGCGIHQGCMQDGS
jgi:hypothetical protein